MQEAGMHVCVQTNCCKYRTARCRVWEANHKRYETLTTLSFSVSNLIVHLFAASRVPITRWGLTWKFIDLPQNRTFYQCCSALLICATSSENQQRTNLATDHRSNVSKSVRVKHPQRNAYLCRLKENDRKATAEKKRVDDSERAEQMTTHQRGSWETLDWKENMKEPWSTAGSPRGIMTVILQCIRSYSAQTA